MQEFLDWLSPIWKLHPGQLAFLEAKAKTKVLACGRRWGKTDVCAVQILSKLTDDKPRRQLIIAPTKAQAKMIYKRIVSLIKRLLNKDLWFQKFIDIPTFKDSDMEITIGHHTIVARSAGQKHNLRGDEADHISVDEAAFVTRELTSDDDPTLRKTSKPDCALLPHNGEIFRTVEPKLPYLLYTRPSLTRALSRPSFAQNPPPSNLMRPINSTHARDTEPPRPSAPSSPAPRRPNPQSSAPPAKFDQKPAPKYSSAPQPPA